MLTQVRLYAILALVAVATGALVALAVSARPVASATAGPRTAEASRRASETPAPTSPRPDARTTSAPLGALLRPLVASWRIDGTTLVAERASEQGSTLVAVPIAGGVPLPLVEVGRHRGWDLRLDGSRFAVALESGQDGRSRIATWDPRTGEVAWATPDAAVVERAPRWSPDGSQLYIGRSRIDGLDMGLFRVRADGLGSGTLIRGPVEAPAVSIPLGFTQDNLTLVWSRADQSASSLELFDLQTGGQRSFAGGAARAEAWRLARPRALVSVAAAGSAPDQLVLWDDSAGSQPRVLLGPRAALNGADWDPTSTRAVASAGGSTESGGVALVTIDPATLARLTIAGSEGGSRPIWLRAGIAYLWQPFPSSAPREVRLIAPEGGVPRTLYRSEADIVRLAFTSP